MRASTFSSAEAPVVFRAISRAPVTDVSHLLAELKPWLVLLKSSSGNDTLWSKFPGIGEPQRQLISSILEAIDGSKDNKPFFSGISRSAFSYHLEGIEDATIVTFEWGD
jgi:hypothetical protein